MEQNDGESWRRKSKISDRRNRCLKKVMQCIKYQKKYEIKEFLKIKGTILNDIQKQQLFCYYFLKERVMKDYQESYLIIEKQFKKKVTGNSTIELAV